MDGLRLLHLAVEVVAMAIVVCAHNIIKKVKG